MRKRRGPNPTSPELEYVEEVLSARQKRDDKILQINNNTLLPHDVRQTKLDKAEEAYQTTLELAAEEFNQAFYDKGETPPPLPVIQ